MELEARKFVETDLVPLVEYSIGSARELEELAGCRFHFSPAADVKAVVIPEMIRSTLVRLFQNSAEAREDCLVRVNLDTATPYVNIEVHDNGPGIPGDIKHRIFDPHFTTKEHNVGLGLVGVKSAIAVHRGNVAVRESDLGGACFRLTIPIMPGNLSAG